MKKLLLTGAALSVLLLGACSSEETQESNEKKTTKVEADNQNQKWEKSVSEIANNNDAVADKFNELEKYALNIKVDKKELNKFQKDIISDYKSGSYLSELDNHERMLSNMFKAIQVEKQTSGPIKDFAFDYYQNLKYAYRGVDLPGSEPVLANESQMDKALSKME